MSPIELKEAKEENGAREIKPWVGKQRKEEIPFVAASKEKGLYHKLPG